MLWKCNEYSCQILSTPTHLWKCQNGKALNQKGPEFESLHFQSLGNCRNFYNIRLTRVTEVLICWIRCPSLWTWSRRLLIWHLLASHNSHFLKSIQYCWLPEFSISIWTWGLWYLFISPVFLHVAVLGFLMLTLFNVPHMLVWEWRSKMINIKMKLR